MLFTRIMAVLTGAMERRVIELPLLNVSLLLQCLLYLLADTYASDNNIRQGP